MPLNDFDVLRFEIKYGHIHIQINIYTIFIPSINPIVNPIVMIYFPLCLFFVCGVIFFRGT